MPEVKIPRDRSVPAAIQFKNPGAMWPGATATKWGSTKWQYLADGTGQGGGGKGNKIAIFDNWVDGIAAQMDLWRSGARYRNKPLIEAIGTWSGGNNVPSYLTYLKARIPGLTNDTIMNDTFWRGPMAIPFLKAQAGHEAGKPIPASQEDYIEAQRRVMGEQAMADMVPAVPTKPILRNGSVGVAVKALQQALGIQADAIFGRETEAAVKVKQKELGLTADGVVGPATWRALSA
jgi:peptidoglycan hydrolase-like protein with peptidoglycan-binding domain